MDGTLGEGRDVFPCRVRLCLAYRDYGVVSARESELSGKVPDTLKGASDKISEWHTAKARNSLLC